MTDRLHLSVALAGAGWHPAAWREPTARPGELTSARYWRDLVRAADDAGITFVTIEDALSFGDRGSDDAEPRTDRVRGRLDAVLLASYLAPLTRRIGLVPTVTTTHPEPFHLATGLQTLDHASGGRAGARIVAGSSAAERANFGRRSDGPDGFPASGRVEDDAAWTAAFREAGEVVEAIRRLTDSWEDDAIIRDLATGRFLDRERVHNIEFEGEFFSITGASIVPRSPQGQPLITALAHQTIPYRFAAEHADLVFITPSDAAETTGILSEIGTAIDEVRSESEPLRVFVDLVVLIEDTADAARAAWARLEARDALSTDARVVVGTADDVVDELRAFAEAGVDGIRLRPARLPADLDAIVDGVVPRATAAGVLHEDNGASTLRERLGLPLRASRYARQEVSA
ncbi:LLM class flavin-dependent oxidoreductase [Microbacterium oxydans]|uniref:Nitrilotriacetate monooxygenase component A n=1 Tax=Microbacterium oxydans TaxID=82380 RepID=A0A0F0LC24_9MICO|nr:LLM class flavin-dependent oxidoreductase [Microbacterium oxydans]KJL29825.1 Nitrilotriacetate monooxygenase component A [Microbacterium oxydans]